MKVIKILGLVFVTALILVIIGGFFLPASVTVERSTSIDRPQTTVFNYLSDFKNFPEWSPWGGIDPNIRYRFEGAESGEGAIMIWSSEHPQVGKGSQQIVATTAPERIVIDLVFDGSKGGDVTYQLQARGQETLVTWSFFAEFGYNPFARYIGLLFDDMLGPYYEAGLSNLKQTLEASQN